MTEYDFSKAHETLTKWLHYNWCYLPDCQDKGVNDAPCRDDKYRIKATFMIAAIAPHFINEIRSGGTQIAGSTGCMDVL